MCKVDTGRILTFQVLSHIKFNNVAPNICKEVWNFIFLFKIAASVNNEEATEFWNWCISCLVSHLYGFKWNEWLVVSGYKVNTEQFYWKILNSYDFVLVDKDKILDIYLANNVILESIVIKTVIQIKLIVSFYFPNFS